MPLKYHGGRGSCPWGATTRRAVRGAQGRPKTRKPRAEFTRPVQRSRFQVLRGDRRVPPERGSAGTVTAGVPGALDARLVYAGYYTEHRRRAPLGPGAVPLVFLSPHFFGKKWGRPPRRRVPRGEPPVIERRAKNAAPYRRPPCMAALRIDSGQFLYPARRAARRVVAPHEEGDPQCPAGDHRSPLRTVKSYPGRSRADDIRPYRPGN